MARERINEPQKTEPTRRAGALLAVWGRPLAVATAGVFCISSAFPVVAAFVKDTEAWPRWWEVLDVAMAFALATLAFAVVGLARSEVSRRAEDARYRAYRVLTHGILALLVVFFLIGDQIVWGNCLTGLAWRAWLLLYGMPSWFTAFGASRP
jgi:VIT1/CCC1 family predicted Fe2+/Mn2+ transporter